MQHLMLEHSRKRPLGMTALLERRPVRRHREALPQLPIGGDGPVGKHSQRGRELRGRKGLRRSYRTPIDGRRHLSSWAVAGSQEAGYGAILPRICLKSHGTLQSVAQLSSSC